MSPRRHLHASGRRWSWVFFGIPESLWPVRWLYIDKMRELLGELAQGARFVAVLS